MWISGEYNINPDGPVVLVSQNIRYTFPFAYGYLSGYLKQKGEDVRVLFRPMLGDSGSLVKKIMELKPVLVGFGSLYPELKVISELIGKLNAAGRRFPIVIGGQMVSPIPEFALKVTGADLGVIGEGEITLYKLVRALRERQDFSNIGGLAIKEKDKVIFTGPGEIIEDLARLPPIPYEFFPEEKWVPIGRYYTDRAQPHWRFSDRVIPIHGGRGCPFTCNFCYHHSKFRVRSINDMMREAKVLLERYSGNMIYFGDDLVIFNTERANDLVKSLRDFKKPVEYSVSARFDVLERIDDTLLREMKDSGCRIMGLGIESGSQRILDLIGKKITVKQVKVGLKRLKSVGILPTVSVMVGQVSEGLRDVEESITLMLDSLKEDNNIEYAFTIATPFPGSPLYSLALQNNLIASDRDFYDRYDFKTRGRPFQLVVNFSSMNDKLLLSMHRKIYIAYKKGKGRFLGKRILLVENLRRFLHRVDLIIKEIFIPLVPRFFRVSFVGMIYQFGYDCIQNKLDIWRLRLRGVDFKG